MSTIIEQSNKEAVSELMSNPEEIGVVVDYLQRMQSGHFAKHHMDLVVQKWERFSQYDIYDAYAFMHVHMAMCLAQVVCCRVYIGREPEKDSDIEGNNEILKSLKPPFSGEFWGGTQGEDGYIFIDKPVNFDMFNLETDERVIRQFDDRFPLEVGYISSAKTKHYLLGPNGRLARWPYGSKDIWLLARVDAE